MPLVRSPGSNMLRLAILRHAEAVPQGVMPDKERPLTEGGRDMAERMGRYFRDEGFVPDLAFVSPSRRTRETFEGLVRGAKQDFKAEFPDSLYNATCDELVTLVE